jgi:hypothetical protein
VRRAQPGAHPRRGLVAFRVPGLGIRVLEITTDRKRDAAWRKDTFASVGAAT